MRRPVIRTLTAATTALLVLAGCDSVGSAPSRTEDAATLAELACSGYHDFRQARADGQEGTRPLLDAIVDQANVAADGDTTHLELASALRSWRDADDRVDEALAGPTGTADLDELDAAMNNMNTADDIIVAQCADLGVQVTTEFGDS